MKKIFVLLVLFISMMIQVQAQINCDTAFGCPMNIAPTSIPWTKAGPTTIVENGCTYYVCYCWRDVGDTIEVYPNPILICGTDPDSDCVVMSGDNYRKIVMSFGDTIIMNNPDGLPWPCPPCPVDSFYYSLYYDGCYTNIFPGTSFCIPRGQALCQYTYSLCCIGITKHLTQLAV